MQPTFLCTSLLLRGAAFAAALTAGPAIAAEPPHPTVEWQARAENVAARVGELIAYGKAYGDDDAKLADAVAGLRDRTATKRAEPAWIKKTSWIEGSAADQVLFGVGVFSGTTHNRQLAFTVAENRARVEIAKLQKVTIVRRSEANGWRTTVTSTAISSNVVIVDWYASASAFYALATYARPVVLAPDAPWIP